MAALYLRKKANKRLLGRRVNGTGGQRRRAIWFFKQTAPNIGGYKFLRQLGPTNVFLLAPVGRV